MGDVGAWLEAAMAAASQAVLGGNIAASNAIDAAATNALNTPGIQPIENVTSAAADLAYGIAATAPGAPGISIQNLPALLGIGKGSAAPTGSTPSPAQASTASIANSTGAVPRVEGALGELGITAIDAGRGAVASGGATVATLLAGEGGRTLLLVGGAGAAVLFLLHHGGKRR